MEKWRSSGRKWTRMRKRTAKRIEKRKARHEEDKNQEKKGNREKR